MKKGILILAAIFAAATTTAQDLDKEVVVTKEYAPTLSTPDKLSVTPRMDDTVALRPDFDYSITPVEWPTHFEQTPITVASTHVWNYRRQPLLYLKAGAGYPLNSIADAAFSWHDANAGGVGAKFTHRGQWSDIADLSGVDRTASHTDNRLSLFGYTKVSSRYTLGARIDGSYRMYHYYGDLLSPSASGESQTLDHLSTYHGDNPLNATGLGGRIWFGSDFSDLSFTNFRITAAGSYLHSAVDGFFSGTEGAADFKAGLTAFDLKAEASQMFSRHGFYLAAGYMNKKGSKESQYKNSIFSVAPRYIYDNGALHVTVGAALQMGNCDFTAANPLSPRFITDGNALSSNKKTYVFPYLRLSYNDGNIITPFAEADGGVLSNDFGSMLERNPYTSPIYDAANSAEYRARIGFTGATRSNTLSYGLWGGVHHIDNMLYPFCYGIQYYPAQDDCTRIVIGGELTFRPIRGLEAQLDMRYYINNIGSRIEKFSGYTFDSSLDETTRIPNYQNETLADRKPLPSFDMNLSLGYTGSKFFVGAKLGITGKYDCLQFAAFKEPAFAGYTLETTCPARIDLGIEAQYDINKRFAVWAEVNNLLNRRNYIYPLYPSVGINCTAGVKIIL